MSEAALYVPAVTDKKPYIMNQWIAYGVPVLFWALMLIAPQQGGDWVWGCISLLGVYFFLKPNAERAVWVLLAYLFSIGGASFSLQGFDISLRQLPGWVAWLSYIIVPLAVLVTFITQPRWKGREVGLPLALLTLISAISAIIHETGGLSWVGWMLHFGRYPLLFLALINSSLRKGVLIAWIKTFIGLSYLQVPATIIQVLVWQVGFSDDIVGTMYGAQTSMMGLTVSMALCVHLSLVLGSKKALLGFIILPLLFIPMFLGAANFAVAISIICILYIILGWGISFVEDHERLKVKINKWMGLLAHFTVILIFGVIIAILISFGADSHELTAWIYGTMPNLSTLDAFIKPEYAAFGSRQMFIATTLQWFIKHPNDLWFGSIGPQVGLGSQGATFAQWLGQEGYYPLAYVNMAAGFPPNTAQSNVQLPRVLLEVGIVGLLCFIWLYSAPLKFAFSLRKKASLTPTKIAFNISLGFQAIWLIVVVLSIFYVDSWRFDQTCFAFWLFAAILWKLSVIEQQIPTRQ